MLIKTIFDLEGIKDQLALLDSLLSHVDLDGLDEQELQPDYRKLLVKMDNVAKNLRKKMESIKKTLDN